MSRSRNRCSCSPPGTEEKSSKVLKIRWKRLISKGETCPRCGSTEGELEKAISTLKKSLAPLGIKVILDKEEISVPKFKKNPLESNRIWMSDRLLEEWIGARVGHSPCCDVCDPHDCGTVKVQGRSYETIPAQVIVKAGLVAASELV